MGGRKRKKPAGKGRPTGKFFFKTGTLLATNDSSVQASVGRFPEKAGDTISDESFVGTGWSGNVSGFFVKILKENSSIYRKNINSNP